MGIKASVTNLTHAVVEAEEATALGAAILGGLGAGVYASVDDAVAAMRYGKHEVAPVTSDVPVYEAIFREVYREVYPAVAPLSQRISDLQAQGASAPADVSEAGSG
jgi:xylulokinase